MESLTAELWKATLSKKLYLIKYLIYRGADVNEPFNTQSRLGHSIPMALDPMTTLLHFAMTLRNVVFVRLLIAHGANCNARDSRGRTPLHYAVSVNVDVKIVEELINQGAIVDARNDSRLTPLHLAVKNGSNHLALKLIAKGASIEAVVATGQNLLHLAAWFKNLTMIKVLISHKMNIHAEDLSGMTPLHCAVRCQKTTEILLDNGADIEKKSRQGIFPLLCAASADCPASLRVLLKRGARVNEANNAGNTALHVACCKGLADVTALLLEYGADFNARNKEGKTPIELLPNGPSSEATAKIVIREAVKREALGESLCEGYIKMVQSQENYSKFDRECREDIKRMRSERIDVEDSAVSFFDIFSKNEEKLTTLPKNQNVVAAVETNNCLASFNMYYFDLITKFEMANGEMTSARI